MLQEFAFYFYNQDFRLLYLTKEIFVHRRRKFPTERTRLGDPNRSSEHSVRQ